jgi:hypothetical protein
MGAPFPATVDLRCDAKGVLSVSWLQAPVVERDRKILLKQLHLRFGELPPAVVTRVEAADTAHLDRWAERVVTASTLEGVLDPA